MNPPKCQRCGTRFDPAFSSSRYLCGECALWAFGRPVVIELNARSNKRVKPTSAIKARGKAKAQ